MRSMSEERLALTEPAWPAWAERVALVALGVSSFAPFVAAAQHAIGRAAALAPLAIDRVIPLVKGWEFVYAAVFFVVFVPVAQVRDRRLLRAVALGIVAMQFAACSVFFLWPTRIERPIDEVLPARSFLDWAVGLNFALDPPVNCFPSLHVANAVFVALVARRLDRRVGAFCLAAALAIALSTLFVKAHLAIDVAAGALLAWVCYRAFVAPRIPEALPGELVFPRKWMLLVLGAYAAFVAVVVSAWALGLRYSWPPAW
jgi:membrane-associated phospholipid phosphatase